MVGDVSFDDVEEISRTYIGTLPSEGLSKSWRSQPDLPAGILTKNISSGLNQASSGFDIQFQQQFPWDGFDEEEVIAGVLALEVDGMFIKKILEDRL